MFQRLVSHNDDLRRLVEIGYAVAFDSNCLLIRDVPYLNSELQLQVGTLVAKLEFVNQERVIQTDHQVFFAGSSPYGLDGKLIPNLGGGPVQMPIGETIKDIVVQRSFSNKPKAAGAFKDFFEKIESYVAIISGPAIELHHATPYTYRVVTETASDSVFKFQDTLTSRAEIADLARKFKDDVVAVIGVGGTGAYVIDFVVKTPVKEVRGFDFDKFHVHNAFRSPGRLDSTELGKTKAEVYQTRYDNFRHGLRIESRLIDATSSEELAGVTFAFVCVDKASARAGIFDLLISLGIPFIDVGMGLKRKEGALTGMARTTYYPVEHAQVLREKMLAPEIDGPDDLYRTNIQIGELNALNAALAVIRFKQLRGFYREETPGHHFLFNISDLRITGVLEDS